MSGWLLELYTVLTSGKAFCMVLQGLYSMGQLDLLACPGLPPGLPMGIVGPPHR